ncbi:uncharacterized protein V2V93DRAFT_376318 [Kockiozyma suomiensis]|uniref:uncharacterized protein n=1 Tax=Kockiozyma suomiensis TaxID=1337062 RepID=UPI003343075A
MKTPKTPRIKNLGSTSTPKSAYKTPKTAVSHLKFTEPDTPLTGYVTADEEFDEASEADDTAEILPKAVQRNEVEQEASDDDEAPEDISFSGGRSKVLAAERARRADIEAAKTQERAKRVAKAEKLKEEKDLSKSKKSKKSKLSSVTEAEEVPVFLPESLLRQVTTSLEEEELAIAKQPKNKRKVFIDEPEITEIQKEDRTIKLLKPAKSKTMAPPASGKTIVSREKWLNRKNARQAKHQLQIMRA